MRRLYAILMLALTVFLYECATVAGTGRKQLNLVSNSELFPMSFDQYTQVMRESKLSNNTEQSAMIKRVGARIQKSVEKYFADNNLSKQLDGYKWEYNLIEENTVNAWCMPGGKVAFYTGIMPICKDEAGVAVVMGHEISHAVANHGRERMSQAVLAQFGLATLSGALGQNPTLTNKMILQASGIGTDLGLKAFSRKNESEADELGLIFMSMAGYHPNEAPKFWERMAANSNGAPPEFLSTHPSHDTRISDLKKLIPKAMTYYNKGK